MVGFFVLAANYLWELFQLWVHTIFVVPFQNTDMLWLLVPVWASWFFAEFFQEKTGTSFGNAITNSVVVLWGSIDCTRQTLRLISSHTITGTWDVIGRFLIVGLVFAYGVMILVWSWKTKKLIKYLGRIREVTYVFAIFTPMFYNAIPFSWELVIAAVIFFPLFYFSIELIDRYTPNPKAIIEDMNTPGLSQNANNNFQPQPIKRQNLQYPQQFRRIPPSMPPRPPQASYQQRPNPYNQYNINQQRPINPYNRYNRR